MISLSNIKAESIFHLKYHNNRCEWMKLVESIITLAYNLAAVLWIVSKENVRIIKYAFMNWLRNCERAFSVSIHIMKKIFRWQVVCIIITSQSLMFLHCEDTGCELSAVSLWNPIRNKIEAKCNSQGYQNVLITLG